MDETVSSPQHESGSISISPESSYDIYLSQSEQVAPPTIEEDPGFQEHVNSLKNTMFYVCQGSCLCGTVNNRGKVIYCYGDLVPRGGDMVMGDGASPPGSTSSKDLLTAQLGVWTFGIVALLIVLILIRKSISSMKRHLEKMTDRLPYHFDDDLISNHSATSPNMHGKDTTMDTMKK